MKVHWVDPKDEKLTRCGYWIDWLRSRDRSWTRNTRQVSCGNCLRSLNVNESA